MVEKVLKIIEKYNLIEQGDNVVVGFSGGPDSTCLLHILHSISKVYNIKLYAVHINHMLRGPESNEDEAFSRSFCEGLSIPIHVKSYDIKKMSDELGISGEETGRKVRYAEFALLAKSLGSAKIAVAHNKNDQAETLLMRIIRGTGIDGLKGMSHKRDNIIRPLLDIERSEIEQYCKDKHLNPRIDSTNLKSIYTRNKIRLELIPFINKTFSTDIVESLSRMSSVIADDCSIIDSVVEKAYAQCIINKTDDKLDLDIDKLNNIDAGIAKRVLRNGIKNIKGDLNGIENIHLEDTAKLMYEGRTGALVQLPQGLRVSRSYDKVRIYKEMGQKPRTEYNKNVIVPGITLIQEGFFKIEAEIFDSDENHECNRMNPDKSFVQIFDYEKLIRGINIRNRREGDVFKPLKSNGTKKLKKYFIDEKIPKDIRDSIPLISSGNEIIWIIGYKTSDNYRVTENTKRILKLSFFKEK